jgi:hypothetical protein
MAARAAQQATNGELQPLSQSPLMPPAVFPEAPAPTSQPSPGRPDLGVAANVVRSQLKSEFAKDMWENYIQGKGDVQLTDAQFKAITQQAAKLPPLKTDQIPLEDGTVLTRKQFAFRGEFAQAVGTASVFYSGNTPVGFYDSYDMNERPAGVRTSKAERETTVGRIVGKMSPTTRDFLIYYGVINVNRK